MGHIRGRHPSSPFCFFKEERELLKSETGRNKKRNARDKTEGASKRKGKDKTEGAPKRNVRDKTERTPKRKAGDQTGEEEKKRLAAEVIQRLKKEYPDTHCTLTFANAWQLLVSVRLAAQCTDLRVDEVTPKLYERFPTVQALSEAPVEEIEAIVRPCGLGKSKARDISKCMKILHETFDDRVPDDFETLLSLPGVGRKSANLIMGDIFGKPAIVTDTHCIRLSNLIGLVDDVKEPGKVEKQLWKIIPPEEGNQLCHRLVDHGRKVCVARRPNCPICCLKDICRHAAKNCREENKLDQTTT